MRWCILIYVNTHATHICMRTRRKWATLYRTWFWLHFWLMVYFIYKNIFNFVRLYVYCACNQCLYKVKTRIKIIISESEHWDFFYICMYTYVYGMLLFIPWSESSINMIIQHDETHAYAHIHTVRFVIKLLCFEQALMNIYWIRFIFFSFMKIYIYGWKIDSYKKWVIKI